MTQRKSFRTSAPQLALFHDKATPQLALFPTLPIRLPPAKICVDVSIDASEEKTWCARTRRDKVGRFVGEIYPFEIDEEMERLKGDPCPYPRQRPKQRKMLLFVRVSLKGREVYVFMPSPEENNIDRFPSTLPPRWYDERMAAILREGSRMMEALYEF